MARRYARDNKGRFASTGSGATARGGRLKTASGNKRQSQTMQVKGGSKGTIGKPKGLKPQSARSLRTGVAVNRMQSINAKIGSKGDGAVVNIPMAGTRGRRLDAEITRNVKAQKAADRAASKALGRKVKAETSRAKKLRGVHEKAAVSKYAAKMGKPATEVRSAIRGMTASQQIKFFRQYVKENRAAAAKPAAKPVAQKPLARSGQKLTVQRFRTNAEMGRKGVVSMSAHSKAVRRRDVAERRAERLSKITERQSGIIARRQINRASTYRPDGSFDQSAANLNQRKLNRSKALQQQLATAATGASMAQSALSRRRQAAAKPARAAATPRTGQEIMKAEVRKVQNKKIRDLNKQIKEAGPNAAGLRLQKLQVQSRLDATRPRQTAKQAAKSAKQTEAVRGRIAEMRRQNARIGRATANKERTADTRGQAGSKMIRRPSQKMTRANNLADRALNFYANPAKALREVRKNRPGFRMPRTMR